MPNERSSTGDRGTASRAEWRPDQPGRFLPTDVGRFGSADETDRPTPPADRHSPPNPGQLLDAVLTQREVVRRVWARKRRLEARTRQANPTPEPDSDSLQRLTIQLARLLLSLAIDTARQAYTALTRLLTKHRRAPA